MLTVLMVVGIWLLIALIVSLFIGAVFRVSKGEDQDE